MSRIARSFRLVKQSYGVLMQDKELMLLPVLSALVTIVLIASFIVPVALLAPESQVAEATGDETPGPVGYALFAVMYILLYIVGIFFQAALIAGATDRLRGGDPTVRSSLAVAWQHIGSIVAWGVVAGTVGLVLRMIADRSEIIGRIVIAVVGAAWTLATFFVVPTLILEGVGVREAFGRSWGLFKKTWGETVVGSGGIGIAASLLMIPVVAIVALLVSMGLTLVAVAVGVLLGGLLLMFMAALQGVYVAVLYRYATTGESTDGFDAQDLQRAYHAK